MAEDGSVSLMDFAITRDTDAAVTVPRYLIAGRFVNSRTGALIEDFTGANAIRFPAVLLNLTPEQRDELISMIVGYLIHCLRPNY